MQTQVRQGGINTHFSGIDLLVPSVITRSSCLPSSHGVLVRLSIAAAHDPWSLEGSTVSYACVLHSACISFFLSYGCCCHCKHLSNWLHWAVTVSLLDWEASDTQCILWVKWDFLVLPWTTSVIETEEGFLVGGSYSSQLSKQKQSQ